MPPRRAGPPAIRSQLPKHVDKVLREVPEAAERLVGRKLPALSTPKLVELRDAVEEIRDYVRGGDVHAVAVLEELQARGGFAASIVSLVGWALRKAATGSSDPREQQLHDLGLLTVGLVAGLLKAACTAQATTVAREAACALASALFKTQVLHAAARQAASGVALPGQAGPGAGPSAGAAASSGVRLRANAVLQAIAALQLLEALCLLIVARQDNALAKSLVSALRESRVFDHVSQLLMRATVFPNGPQPPPPPPVDAFGLAAVQTSGLMWLSVALTVARPAQLLKLENPDAIVTEVLGPCSCHAVLVLGTAALAKADGGPCGLPRNPLLEEPRDRSEPLPALNGATMLLWLSRLSFDQRQPQPSVPPRAALRLLTRMLRLASATIRAGARGAVTPGPGRVLRVDLGWGNGRRAETLECRLLLPCQLGGTMALHSAMALQDLAMRWPQVWAAEAAQSWGPLVTAVRHGVAVEESEQECRLGMQPLATAIDLAGQCLVPAKGQAPPLFFSQARLPPCVAAALEGGVVPLFETLFRAAGEDLRGPEVVIVGHVFSLPGPRQSIAMLAAHSPPRQAAAFAATLAKLLRKAPVSTLMQPFHVDGEALLWGIWLLVANKVVEMGLEALPSAQASEEPAGPVDPAASCAPVLALSSAALQLLPEVMRLLRQAAGQMLADPEAFTSADSFITPTHISLWAVLAALGPAAWFGAPTALGASPPAGSANTSASPGGGGGGGVRGMGGASLLPGKAAVRRPAQSRPAHRLASAVCLPFLVEECGAVPLLGALLELFWRAGSLPGLGATYNSLLAKACLGVYAAYPQHVQRLGGSSGAGGGAEGTFPWNPEALRVLAHVLWITEPALSLQVHYLAVELEGAKLVAAGGAGASAQSGPVAALAAEAERLAVLKAEARALLPACANPACVNLAGDSEAGLKLQVCRGCMQSSYCCRECQTAHWKAGHKALCGGKGR